MGRIFLLLAVVGPLVNVTRPVSADDWGHLAGQIIYDGPRPTPAELKATTDVDFCGKHELVDESLIVGKNGGLKNAVVFLYRKRRDPKPRIHPSYAKTEKAKVILDNVDCSFVPHVLAIRKSQTLVVKNSDPIGHNAKIVSMNNEHNPSIPANSEVEITLDVAESIPASVSCGSHPWMSAHLLIREDPYFAITDENGRFRIENLPAGKWKFRFWHERCGSLRDLTQNGEKFLGRRGEIEVDIKPGETFDFGTLKIRPQSLKKK